MKGFNANNERAYHQNGDEVHHVRNCKDELK